MSIHIKYKEPDDRPIYSVKAMCDYRDGDCIESHAEVESLGRVKVGVHANGTYGPVLLTLDDAEAFFKAGLQLVEQQRRAK